MKIIFLAVKDYTLSLIFANVDTLESRREQLTERFFRRSVLRESSCLHYLLPDKRDSVITDRLYATQKHSSQCWWKPRNFAIHLYHTVSNIMISTAVANYVVHTNRCRRHWTISSRVLQHFAILLYIVLIQLFAARTNKPLSTVSEFEVGNTLLHHHVIVLALLHFNFHQ